MKNLCIFTFILLLASSCGDMFKVDKEGPEGTSSIGEIIDIAAYSALTSDDISKLQAICIMLSEKSTLLSTYTNHRWEYIVDAKECDLPFFSGSVYKELSSDSFIRAPGDTLPLADYPDMKTLEMKYTATVTPFCGNPVSSINQIVTGDSSISRISFATCLPNMICYTIKKAIQTPEGKYIVAREYQYQMSTSESPNTKGIIIKKRTFGACDSGGNYDINESLKRLNGTPIVSF